VRARALLKKHAGGLLISAISGFEIGLKHRKGRLSLPMAPDAWMARALEFHGIAEVAMTWRIAERSTAIAAPHGDPSDRIILATAEALALPVLTPDPRMKACPGVSVEW
jgi:PIN domain nuclease of toxin-antitoxin system